MLSYRNHIYILAMAASAEATKLALDLSNFMVDWRLSSDYQATVDQRLPELKISAQSLRSSLEKLENALPAEVSKDIGNCSLARHLWIIEYYRRPDGVHPIARAIQLTSYPSDIPSILTAVRTMVRCVSRLRTMVSICA